jgi:hypothetical protein
MVRSGRRSNLRGNLLGGRDLSDRESLVAAPSLLRSAVDSVRRSATGGLVLATLKSCVGALLIYLILHTTAFCVEQISSSIKVSSRGVIEYSWLAREWIEFFTLVASFCVIMFYEWRKVLRRASREFHEEDDVYGSRQTANLLHQEETQ